MPRRYGAKKTRRSIRKRTSRRGTFRRRTRSTVPRGLRQAVIPMQRTKTVFINTANSLPAGWDYGTASGYHTLRNQQVFQLLDLPDTTEFQALFRTYKLNCVVVSINNLHNSSMFTSGSAQNYYVGNLICYAQKNLSGVGLDSAITQDYWDQQGAKITRLITGNKTLTFKVYPKMLRQNYLSDAANMTSQTSPTWNQTSVSGRGLPHYGLNMQFSYTDPGLPFNNAVVPDAAKAAINLRITYKYLFQLRGIH